MKQTGKSEPNISYKLSFLNEEEGVLSFFEEEREILRFHVYPVCEDEAELTAQNVGFLGNVKKIEDMPRKIIDKMTNCIEMAISTLEEYGYETIQFVEQKSTIFEQILGSTAVVNKEYSEWMMKSPGLRKKTTSSCENELKKLIFTETEDGFVCFDEEKDFFARVSPFKDGWYVYEVEVAYDKRRIGIGTGSMRRLEERFLQLYLQVGSYNEPAVGLYRKLGFQVIEELCYYGKA